MEFYIKKNATLPLLKMQVVRDGRSEYQTFVDSLGDATIFFTMINEASGIPKIVSKPAYITEVVNDDPNALPEYYVYFRFTERDTNQVGMYSGEFLIHNDQGDLVLPLREELYIYIQESFIIKSPCC